MTNSKLFSLVGKNGLVTGATGHLGREMARALAEAGAHVWVNGRHAATCQTIVDDLLAQGFRASPACFDITKEQEIADFFACSVNVPLNFLVNNAYAGGGGTVETATATNYRQSYEVTVISAQMLISQALPYLRRAVVVDGEASVINISSMFGLVSPDPGNYDFPEGTNPPFYGAAKAALAQFTRYAACEFGPEGIRVNAIAPGPFPAPAVEENAPDFFRRLEAKVPMKRVGRAEEIGGPVVFLAAPAASFVNGTTLVVDGGWTSW